ncbi:Epidermal growth factor receptor [Trichinella murrelli]|uniref:receptor protein-tyrosine kinase n=1 Tax=Trichinella murrelli TaxID=144512 RepID=A0A0V0U822_9BILA|nr:Epidermal growth factor receptor [Trichinella murrelli]
MVHFRISHLNVLLVLSLPAVLCYRSTSTKKSESKNWFHQKVWHSTLHDSILLRYTEFSFSIVVCSGTENGLNKLEVHEKKVERLRMMYANCTVVHGNLEITYLTPDDLKDAGISDLHFLNDIVEVTGYVLIAHNSIRNFSLPSLQIIWGDKKFRPTSDQMVSQFGLLVLNNAFSTFDLSNLRAIHDGSVGIQMNHRMCHWKTIDFRQLLGDNYEKRLIIRDSYGDCYADAVCDSSCVHCWGSEKRHCQKIYRNNCAPQCSSGMCYDVDSPQFCCHPECAAGCFGPSDSECYGCSTMRDNGKCVDKCPTPELYDPITTQYVKNPDGKYAFNRDCVTTCPEAEGRTCDVSCDLSQGCWGPGSEMCFECLHWRLGNVCVDDCSSDGEYQAAPKQCALCHPECISCTGPVWMDFDISYFICTGSGNFVGIAGCNRCKYGVFDEDTQSIVNLLHQHSLDSGRADECIPCDSQCDGCIGPTSTDCVECVTYKDYLSDTDRFNCTNVCPADRPYISADRLCTDINMDEVIYEKNKRMQTIVISAVVAALFLGFVVFLILILFMKRKASLLAHLEEPDPKLEINSEACPNLTRLLLIRESELKRGGILGYGAFGAVYKGVWIPQKEKVKVPVAIKVLHEANAAAQQETLEEARIMASVSHTYLVRLIGVCVGQQMMLVTPLMPLGNLLDYVQENKSKIGSAALIRWSSQIAGGMCYLEEHRLVHRDLAARNVLVKTPYHVRITDFGLAKLLEYGQEEIKIFEGKMPIKWLALECIQYRRYTHKSDVWAFGVTLWELFTFGEKPYKDVPLHDIPRLLENGERLPQPKIATLDMYMLLIRCWMVDADARPSFKELRESFLKMAKDPGRFLVVEGDALLRLPTYTPQDQQQMIRQLIDDPDVIDPEDYFSAPTASPLVSPVTPTKPLIDDVEMRLACGPPHRHAGSVSQRYASDPFLIATVLWRLVVVIGKLLDNSSLSTDQDNYLIPDSQQPQRQSFIHEDDGVFVNYSPMPAYNGYKVGNHVYYNDFPPEKSGICLENFEYMQGGNGGAIYTNTCPMDCNADSVQTETVV